MIHHTGCHGSAILGLSLLQPHLQALLHGVVDLDMADLSEDAARNAAGVTLNDLMLAGLRCRAGVGDGDVVGPALEAGRVLVLERHGAGVQLVLHRIQVVERPVIAQHILALIGHPLQIQDPRSPFWIRISRLNLRVYATLVASVSMRR